MLRPTRLPILHVPICRFGQCSHRQQSQTRTHSVDRHLTLAYYSEDESGGSTTITLAIHDRKNLNYNTITDPNKCLCFISCSDLLASQHPHLFPPTLVTRIAVSDLSKPWFGYFVPVRRYNEISQYYGLLYSLALHCCVFASDSQPVSINVVYRDRFSECIDINFATSLQSLILMNSRACTISLRYGFILRLGLVSGSHSV